MLKNVKVRPTEDDFGNKLKAWIADKGLRLFSDRVPDRNAVVTIIPIKGRLDDPDVQLWPTVLGVVRNAFVEGISSGFTHLPPPTADKPQGKFEQVKKALKKDEGPPEAQPDRRGREAAGKGRDEKSDRHEAVPLADRWRFAIALAGGCAHTKTTDERHQQGSREEEATRRPKPRAAAGEAARGERHAQSAPRATATPFPWPPRPGRLLVPGAERQDSRAPGSRAAFSAGDAKSSDAAMREGLRRFQRAKDLPATGMPDHETVKRLGLDPDQIFRQADPSKTEHFGRNADGDA